MKRSRILEIVSNIQRKKFVLNVRRDGPQPSIFVRSFSQITSKVLFQGKLHIYVKHDMSRCRAEVWMFTEEGAIVVIEPPSSGIFINFPLK